MKVEQIKSISIVGLAMLVAIESSIIIHKTNSPIKATRAIETVTAHDAMNWIKYHRGSDAGNVINTTSFIVNKKTLDDYATAVTNQNHNIPVEYYHIFLARTTEGKPNTTTLVVSAVGKNISGGTLLGYKHFYTYEDAHNMVLEHCDPCPKCLIGDFTLQDDLEELAAPPKQLRSNQVDTAKF